MQATSVGVGSIHGRKRACRLAGMRTAVTSAAANEDGQLDEGTSETPWAPSHTKLTVPPVAIVIGEYCT